MTPDATANRDTRTTGPLVLGAIVSILVVLVGQQFYPAAAPVSDAVPDRFACYLPYLAAMAAPALLVMLGMMRNVRFDGATRDRRLTHSERLLIDHGVQLAVAVAVHLALLVLVPFDWLNVVPLLAVWWTAVRLIATYVRSPAAQAFAFAAAFTPAALGAIAVPILVVTNALARAAGLPAP